MTLLAASASGCDDPSASGSETDGDSQGGSTGGTSGGAVTQSGSPSTTAGTPSPSTTDTPDPSAGEETGDTGDATGGPAPECKAEDPAVACYDGDRQTRDVGLCVAGSQACQDEQWSDCAGQVLPVRESCNGEDDDCDGDVDEGCECLPLETQPCYEGDAGTQGVGLCAPGEQSCQSGAWSVCTGQVVPDTEICNGSDDDCDGVLDEGCDCLPDETQSCYSGPAATQGVGVCEDGVQTCNGTGAWGPCVGAVLPGFESCNGEDDDCDGAADEFDEPGACDTGQDGACGVGVQACSGGGLVCEATVTPQVETCDGEDNDCDGATDEGLVDDPILLEGELSDNWSGSVLVASYPGQSSGSVPARLDSFDDVDWFSVFAQEQVIDLFGDTPVTGTVTIQSPGAGFSYRVCACWSTAASLCGKNASGGVPSCVTASNGGSAQVSVDMAMIQGTTDVGYLDVQVFAAAGSETGCETYDVLWSVSES
ncbi:MAG: hypothetical protein KUG77_05355 [Nannocystaceae bacterium]|nr:hypothetical protein [Nannocystaceae bacterium]